MNACALHLVERASAPLSLRFLKTGNLEAPEKETRKDCTEEAGGGEVPPLRGMLPRTQPPSTPAAYTLSTLPYKLSQGPND